MNIKSVAIDDEPLALKVLEDYINKTPFLELVEKFTNPVKAYNFLNENEIDLLFVDIQMPDLSGLDVASKLKQKPVLIFTTAYSEYAMEGFKADAIDYLLKPIDYPEFLKAVNKAKDWIYAKRGQNINIQSNKDFLFIKSEHKIIRINFSEIRYIQGMSEYARIYLTTSKPIMSLVSLKHLETQLPADMFMRVHKSYIVNLQKINIIERFEIIYDDGTKIPVSQQYKSKFQEYLDKNFML
jgi:two-component system, LytTR family, response regulator LytT